MAQPLGLDAFFRQDEERAAAAVRPLAAGGLSDVKQPAPTTSAEIEQAANDEQLTPTQRKVYLATLAQESGSGRNARTSVDGARGAGQIMPDTFRRYAKAGESIDNPADNLRVSARIIRDLGNKTGDDPARMAVGYFSGDGNINPAGTTPWKNDRADGNGKTVSSYVSDLVGRVAGVQEAQAAPVKPQAAQPAQAALPDLSKAPTWAQVAAKPEYQALPPEQRAQAKAAYFDYWVAPHAGAKAPEARQWFMSQQDGLAPDNRGFWKTVGDTAQNLGAAVLKIGPTAVKGVADIGNMLTGDKVNLGVSAAMERGMKAIDEAIASDRFNQQDKAFASLMKDDTKGVGDMFAFLLDNPSVLVDKGITTIGSMFLPAGAAKGAVMAGRAAGLGQAAVTKAAVATSIGTGAAQNAADTFDELKDRSLEERYRGAAVSAAISILTGMATGGGADGAIAKKLAGDLQAGRTTLEAVKAFFKAAGKEGFQESGEEIGNIAGETAGGKDLPTLAGAAKRTTLAGTLGAAVGGVTNVATKGSKAANTVEQTPDGRLKIIVNGVAGDRQEPTIPPAESATSATDSGGGEAGAPPVHPTSKSADAIVEELAAQAGIPRETVLPNASSEDIAAEQQALLKAEQANKPGMLPPLDQEGEPVNETDLEQAQGNGPAPGARANGGDGQPGGPAAVEGANGQGSAAQENAANGQRIAGKQGPAVQGQGPVTDTKSKFRALLDEEFDEPAPPKTEKEARERREQEGHFSSVTEHEVDTEDNGKFKVKVGVKKDGGVTIFDGPHVYEHNADFARGKTVDDLLRYQFEPVGFRSATTAENASGTEAPEAQQAEAQGSQALEPATGAVEAPKTEKEARERRKAEQEASVVSRTDLPDGMEVRVFKTPDGHGYALYDKDAGEYVNGSVTRFSQGDTLTAANKGAADLAQKSTPSGEQLAPQANTSPKPVEKPAENEQVGPPQYHRMSLDEFKEAHPNPYSVPKGILTTDITKISDDDALAQFGTKDLSEMAGLLNVPTTGTKQKILGDIRKALANRQRMKATTPEQLEQMTVADLKTLADDLGVSHFGNKETLTKNVAGWLDGNLKHSQDTVAGRNLGREVVRAVRAGAQDVTDENLRRYGGEILSATSRETHPELYQRAVDHMASKLYAPPLMDAWGHVDAMRGTDASQAQKDVADALEGMLTRGNVSRPGQAPKTKPAAATTTPGTRISFSNVGEWVDGYKAIDNRAPSSNRYTQLSSHVGQLTDEVIGRETDPEALKRARGLFETANGLKPPRGQRAGTPYERVMNAIDRRLTALKPKTERAAIEQRKADRAGLPIEFFKALSRAGGIDIGLQHDITGERSGKGSKGRGNVLLPGLGGTLFRKGGQQLDELASRMVDHGYLSQADIDSDLDNGGINKLTEMIGAALRGEKIYKVGDNTSATEDSYRRAAERQADADLHAEAGRRGVDTEGKTIKEIADDVANAIEQEELRDANTEAALAATREIDQAVDDHGLDDSEWDEAKAIAQAMAIDEAAVERAAMQYDDPVDFIRAIQGIIDGNQGAKARRGQADRATSDGQAGQQEGGRKGAGQGEEAQDLLTQPTSDELRQREEAAKKAAADKAAADRAADQKDRVDAEVDSFELTGQGITNGQEDMFGNSPASTEPVSAKSKFASLLDEEFADEQPKSDRQREIERLDAEINKLQEDFNQLDSEWRAAVKDGMEQNSQVDLASYAKDNAKLKIANQRLESARAREKSAESKRTAVANKKGELWRQRAELLRQERAQNAPKEPPRLASNNKALAAAPDDTLVLIACSDTKVDTATPVPLFDLYNGPQWLTLRKRIGSIPKGNVFALSGKHGLVPASFESADYNEQMTPDKADGIIRQAADLAQTLKRDGAPYINVVIYGASDYRRAFSGLLQAATQAGVVARDAAVRVPSAGAGIGQQRGALGEWLDEVNGAQSAPRNEAEAAENRARNSEKTATSPAESRFTGRKVALDVLVQDTGRTVKMEVDAQQHLDELAEREKAIDDLIKCMSK